MAYETHRTKTVTVSTLEPPFAGYGNGPEGD